MIKLIKSIFKNKESLKIIYKCMRCNTLTFSNKLYTFYHCNEKKQGQLCRYCYEQIKKH